MNNPAYAHYPATAAGARALDAALYFTGMPCVRGHLAPRYASSSNCLTCIEEKRGKAFVRTDRTQANLARANTALALGHTTYVSEAPCPRGHTLKYVSSNNCVECNALQMSGRREASRWRRLVKEYGLTREAFAALLYAQWNSCAVCKTPLNDKNTHVDHCHTSQKVRGLLCSRCNQGIGLFRESEGYMLAAIDYLKGAHA